MNKFDEIIQYVITDSKTINFQLQNADLYSKEYLSALKEAYEGQYNTTITDISTSIDIDKAGSSQIHHQTTGISDLAKLE